MELGVKYVRGLPGKVHTDGGKLRVDVDDMLTGRRLQIPPGVVVLSAGVGRPPPDSTAQAGPAAMSAAVFLGRGEMTLNPLVAEVDPALCRACDRCTEVCEFDAVRVDPDRPGAGADATPRGGGGGGPVVC